MLYQIHEESVSMIKNTTFEPELKQMYREYIQNNYSLEKQFKETDEWLGLWEDVEFVEVLG